MAGSRSTRIATMISPTVASKRRAPYTSSACNTCRRRRCKCDGVHPTCGTCSFYGHECNWNQEDVSQRPATKQLVQSLRLRVRELESELAQLAAEPMGGTREQTSQENSAMTLVDPVVITDETQEEFPRRSRLTMREGYISASGPTSVWSTFLDEPPPLKENKIPHPGLVYRYTFERDPSMPLHMQSQEIQMSERCEWDRHLPKLSSGIGFTRFEHDTLLCRCFNYHTPWLRTLEPHLFLHDMLLELTSHTDSADTTKSSRRLAYYSPFLHCALMSLAAAFSTNHGVRSKLVREQFARRAKQLLEDECERPTFTAIQGLVFLSEYHGSLGERGLAYLYFGMSCRMGRALGLCINGRVMVDCKMITEQELASRTRLFWALFCQDKLMSFEYGRDYDVPLPHLDVDLPTVDSIRDQHTWDEIQPMGSRTHTSRPNHTTLAFYQGCRLMLIGIRIMGTVYIQGRQQLGMTENDSIDNLHKLLENWYKDLPAQVRVPSQSGGPPLPHIIILHITYWWLLILLHRPFSFRVQSPSSTLDWQVPAVFADLSADICERAAKNTVQLIAAFSQTYGCQLFPLNMLQAVFMAGTILLSRCATLPGSANEQHADACTMVQECIRTLHGAAQTWAVAQLYASRLEALLSEQILRLSPDSQSAHLHAVNDNKNHYPGSNIYEPSALEHDETISRMFRDFINHHYQDAEELGIPLTTIQFQYPLLQQPNQQPPSGPEFIIGPDFPSHSET